MARRNHDSIIDWRTLRARKGHLDLRNEDIIREAQCGPRALSALLCGDENLNLSTIIRLSAALGLKPRITFEPMSEASDNVVELKIA